MNAPAPKVSVIVPVHRGMDCLAGLLDALASQTLPVGKFEVIVVDNGGNPGIQELVARFPGSTLVTEQRRGSYAARNTGTRHAGGEVLAFTDADCRPARDWLAKGSDALERDGGSDLVAGHVDLQFSRDGPASLAERYEALTAFPQEHYVKALNFGVTANLFVRRSVFDALRGFDGALQSGGDRDFGQRAKDAGFRLIYAPSVQVVHPARATMRSLISKAWRVAGGEMALWESGKVSFSRRQWLNMLLPPMLWSWRLLRDADCHWTTAQRLTVILVRQLLHLVILPVRLAAILRRRGTAGCTRPADGERR
jgi:glycosyltransferase involved in cell wall biosynthesis